MTISIAVKAAVFEKGQKLYLVIIDKCWRSCTRGSTQCEPVIGISKKDENTLTRQID